VIVIPLRILGKLIQRLFKTKKRYFQYCESIRPKNIPGAAGGDLSHGTLIALWVHRHLEAELHGMTKQFDQLLAQGLPALNDSLKSKGQQPLSTPAAKVGANSSAGGGIGTTRATGWFQRTSASPGNHNTTFDISCSGGCVSRKRIPTRFTTGKFPAGAMR
jgi:hypothetical protein